MIGYVTHLVLFWGLYVRVLVYCTFSTLRILFSEFFENLDLSLAGNVDFCYKESLCTTHDIFKVEKVEY